MNQCPGRGPPSLDDVVGRLPVKRITLLTELAKFFQRIHTLQQRTLGVVPKPARQLLRRGPQVEAEASCLQPRPVLRPEHDAPASGQHTRPAVFEAGRQNLGLQLPEGYLTMGGKKVPDRHADPGLFFRPW